MATLELTVLFPVLLLLIFGVIQGALLFHGRNVALAAAEQGVRAARLDGQPNPAGTAQQQARQFLVDTGELDNLSELSIVPTVNDAQVRVTVSARTVSLLPGLPGPRVSQTAAGSLERFTSRSSP
jgi:Flp pilus assembly protein TadG